MATGNTARNDVTNDLIKSKPISKEGRENWDNIFSSKNKLILASAQFCGPCSMLKSRITKESLEVEIKQMENESEFFRQHNIKTVPRLLIFKGDELMEVIQGSDDILQRIKSENS
jgi:hypothetical protein